jgi:hypothetical protein
MIPPVLVSPPRGLTITHNFCELVGTAHEADSR